MRWSSQGNQFGLLFHKAAENIGGGYSMDSFDATGIRVRFSLHAFECRSGT